MPPDPRTAAGGSAVRDYTGMLLAGGVPVLVAIPAFGVLVARGMEASWANVLVLSFSLAFTFGANLLVFRRRRPDPWRSLARFAIVTSVTIALDLAAVAAAASLLGSQPIPLVLVKAAAIATGLLLRLVLFRRWVFT